MVKIKRRTGIAGQFSVTAITDDGDSVTFVGDVYGAPGPVVMITPAGSQVFVTDPGRFGAKFGTEWVKRFLADGEES